jgi:mono/diheme cytochrome c family protein
MFTANFLRHSSVSHLVASVAGLMITASVGCAHHEGTDDRHAATPARSVTVHTNAIEAPTPAVTTSINARTLFLRNCAHCHGADARGDDGPDLHDLDFNDQWIGKRIRNGKAGQMTAFKGKLKEEEIQALVIYVKSLSR